MKYVVIRATDDTVLGIIECNDIAEEIIEALEEAGLINEADVFNVDELEADGDDWLLYGSDGGVFLTLELDSELDEDSEESDEFDEEGETDEDEEIE